MATRTVVETLVAELDGVDVGLTAALEKANAKIAGLEARASLAGKAGAEVGKRFQLGSANIVSGATAAGLAIVALGVAGEHLAEQFDGTLRQIAAVSPALKGALPAVAEDIEQLADVAGRAHEEVAAAAQEAARLGVQSEEELRAKLTAAALVADATGADLKETVGGVDQLADAFDLSTDQIVGSLAKIYSASKGKVDFSSVFESLKTSIPRIQKLNLDFDTAIKATVALLDRGFSGKKIGAFFNDHDADGIRQVASEAKIADGALKELQDAAGFRRGGTDREFQRSVNAWNGALRDLGTTALPIVTTSMKGWVEIIDLLRGKLDDIDGARLNATLVTLTANFSKLSAASKQSQLPRLKEALIQNAGAIDLQPLVSFLPTDRLAKLDTTKLKTYRDALAAIAESGTVTGVQLGIVQENVRRLDTELAKPRSTSVFVGPPTPAGLPGPKRGALPATEAEKAAVAEALKFAQDAVREMQNAVGKGTADLTKSGLDNALADVDAFARTANAKIAEMIAKKAPQSAIDAYTTAAQERQQQLIDAAIKLGDEETKKRTLQMRELVASMTPTLVDDMRVALEKLQQQLADAGQSQAFIDRVTAIQNHLIDAQAETEHVTKAITDLQAAGMKPMAEQRALSDLETEIQRKIDALNRSTDSEEDKAKARLELEKDLAVVEARKNALGDENLRTVNAQIAAEDALAQHAGDVAANIESAANAGYGLVQAFGAGNTELGRMMASIGQISGGISKVMAGASGGALFGALGAVVGGGIALASIFGGGSSAADAERQRVIEANTQAIRELTAKGGLLGSVGLSGTDARSALDAIAKVTGRFSTIDIRDAQVGGATKKADLSGLTPQQIAAINAAAKALGITLDGTQQGFYDLQRILSSSLQVLGEFSSDFAGSMSQFDAAIKVFGSKGPLGDLGDYIDTVAKKSPLVKSLLESLPADRSQWSPADIARIKQTLQDWFTTMEAGGDKLDPAQMGIAGDAFLQFIEQAMDWINKIPDAAATAAAALKSQQIDQGLEVRRLRATGDADAADALNREMEKQAELAQALADGWTDAEIAALKLDQALEDQAAAAAKAAAAAAQVAKVDGDLEVRRLRALGQNDAADALARQQQEAAELAQAQQEHWSEAEIAALELDQALEDQAAATQKATAAAKAAADAAAKSVKVDEDLEARRLRASGDTVAADAITRWEQEQAEIAQAIADGWTDEQIAALKVDQALEDQAAAAQRAADADKAAADAAAAKAAAVAKSAKADEDLEVRRLQALGNTDAADALKRREDEEAELAQAIADGYTDAQLAALKLVQGLEDQAAATAKAAAAAQQLKDDQLAQLEESFRILGTTASVQAKGYADLFGFQLGDTSTAGGRDAAVEMLRAAFQADPTNKALADEIDRTLGALQSIDFGQGTATSPAGGDPNASFAADVRTITIGQASEGLDLWRGQLSTLLQIATLQTTMSTQLGAIYAVLAAAQSMSITPPAVSLRSLSPGAGAAAGSGGVTITVTIENQFNAPVGAVDRAAAAELSDRMIHEIDRALAQRFTDARFGVGDTTIRRKR